MPPDQNYNKSGDLLSTQVKELEWAESWGFWATLASWASVATEGNYEI